MAKKKYTLEEFKGTFDLKYNELFTNFRNEFNCENISKDNLTIIVVTSMAIIERLKNKIFEEEGENNNDKNVD